MYEHIIQRDAIFAFFRSVNPGIFELQVYVENLSTWKGSLTKDHKL